MGILNLAHAPTAIDVRFLGLIDGLLEHEGFEVRRLARPGDLASFLGDAAIVFGPRRLEGVWDVALRLEDFDAFGRWVAEGRTALLLSDGPLRVVGRPWFRWPGRRDDAEGRSRALEDHLKYGVRALLGALGSDPLEDRRIPLPGGRSLIRLPIGSGSILLGLPEILGPPTPGRPAWASTLVEALAHLVPGEADREVRARMGGPQRHRLLQGYPMRPLMRRLSVEDRADGPGRLAYDPSRTLLVGVLPHASCNPSVEGCGFCTFPHERYSAPEARRVVAGVIREVERTTGHLPGLRGRAVAGLYFGGGTANLTPPDAFRDLCRALGRAFDLSGAEVSLEGVPAYFLGRREALLDILREEIPARRLRISMGIQTFDPERLAAMGRAAFGTPETFEEVVRLAHDRGMAASADLLFNLPHQGLDAMRDDVRRAVDIGLDQVCLYHLVMFQGLNTPWSADPALLAGLPENPEAARRWVALREQLLDAGFEQTTLTNFERAGPPDDPRRFAYEVRSMSPESHDVAGFGPSGISFAADARFRSAFKVQNALHSREYLRAVEADIPPSTRGFAYVGDDLRVLYLTRKVSRLGVDRAGYRSAFGTDPVADFPLEFEALERAGLLAISVDSIRPTPTGMFYSDTIAGLLAARRVRVLRLERVLARDRRRRGLEDDPNSAAVHHMG